MNKTPEPIKDKHYETPEIQDIAPVSTVTGVGPSPGGGDAGDGNNDGGGE